MPSLLPRVLKKRFEPPAFPVGSRKELELSEPGDPLGSIPGISDTGPLSVTVIVTVTPSTR